MGNRQVDRQVIVVCWSGRIYVRVGDLVGGMLERRGRIAGGFRFGFRFASLLAWMGVRV